MTFSACVLAVIAALASATAHIHVPYKGAGPLLVDLVAGQTHFAFATWSSSGPHVKSGRLRGLAVTTAARGPALPDLPAMAETVPGDDIAVWYGVGSKVVKEANVKID